MTIVSEQYDDYFLVYDYDEKPIRPYKLSLKSRREDIDNIKETLTLERAWEARDPE